MPRGVKKEHLPTKICVVCNRPFNWRKKWERVWDEVTTCSKSCNKKRKTLEKEKKKKDVDVQAPLSPAPVLSAASVPQETFFERTPDDVSDKIGESKVDGEGVEENIMALALESDEKSIESIQSSLTNDEKDDLVHQSGNETDPFTVHDDPIERKKAERKAAKKAKKAARRAQREGRGDPTAGQKQCDMCGKLVDLLVRCTYDESEEWKMVCGKCWKKASGGVVDGDEKHPYYRYGGLWKNRRAQK